MPESLTCPYCSRPAAFVDSECVYGGRSYGMIYICKDCDAYVGVHKGTEKPLGRLANKELREWKKRAHAAFDPLWQEKYRRRVIERGPEYKKVYARGSGYKWLREQMGLTAAECHIGMFDVAQCKQVVEICSKYYNPAKNEAQ